MAPNSIYLEFPATEWPIGVSSPKTNKAQFICLGVSAVAKGILFRGGRFDIQAGHLGEKGLFLLGKSAWIPWIFWQEQGILVTGEHFAETPRLFPQDQGILAESDHFDEMDLVYWQN